MRVRLHKPKRIIWNLALLFFLLGILATYIPIPVLSQFAFQLIIASNIILLLGTWII